MTGSPARFKIAAVSGALAIAIALLTVESSRSATVYYQTLPEIASAPPSTRPVRVLGYVRAGTTVRDAGKPLRFVMEDEGKASFMEVSYAGIVPDTFKDGAEVVVEGRRAPGGAFEASTLLAKCPSKYESAEGKGAAAPVS